MRQDLDDTLTDAKTAYLASCADTITAAGLKVTDAFTSAWATKYAATGDSCFQSIPAYLTAENQFTLNSSLLFNIL